MWRLTRWRRAQRCPECAVTARNGNGRHPGETPDAIRSVSLLLVLIVLSIAFLKPIWPGGEGMVTTGEYMGITSLIVAWFFIKSQQESATRQVQAQTQAVADGIAASQVATQEAAKAAATHAAVVAVKEVKP